MRVLETGLATYPDVTVVCGASERDPESPTHVTNPKVIVEVLSPSTEEYDQGEKLSHYQRIAALEAVALVHHAAPHVELWSRGDDGWRSESYGAGEAVPLDVIGCELGVDSIYAAAREA